MRRRGGGVLLSAGGGMDLDKTRPAILFLLPNLISAFRLAAAPFLALAALTVQSPALAAAIVAAAALSDILDGFVARLRRQVSDLGAVLDPIADKAFILTALCLLLGDGVIQGLSAWAALAILWREVLISGLRDYARFRGQRASVGAAAKIKTAAQFAAVGLLFASRVPSWRPDLFALAGSVLLWISAGFALYSATDYISRARRGSWT